MRAIRIQNQRSKVHCCDERQLLHGICGYLRRDCFADHLGEVEQEVGRGHAIGECGWRYESQWNHGRDGKERIQVQGLSPRKHGSVQSPVAKISWSDLMIAEIILFIWLTVFTFMYVLDYLVRTFGVSGHQVGGESFLT